MRRIEETAPGHDCMKGHDATLPPDPKCVRGSGGFHGWHGDEWVYAVVDDEMGFALALAVATNEVRGVAVMEPGELYPRAAGLSLHSRSDRGVECCYLGKCRNDVGYLMASEFFEAHAVRAKEQPESFWLALEAKCREIGAQTVAEARRLDEEEAAAERAERLRDAAPDLYDALKAVADALTIDPLQAKVIDFPALLSAAGRAIAKAEGR